MGKFKVNDSVRVIATGEIGTVKGREVIPVEDSKRVKIEYIVKVGKGFENWKSYSKKELETVRTEKEEPRVYTKVYDVVDGYKVTMYAKVDNRRTPWPWGDTKERVLSTGYSNYSPADVYKERVLSIGYSIYSPADVYNENLGIKIARHRSKSSPFCLMFSKFSGEFNASTVNAIMDVKADYIKNNFDKFINRKSK